MRWWWCIMHDVYLLLFEAWITISVCGAPGKIIGKISLPFSVGSLSYPKKVEDCRADPVNLWGPRNLLFVCALMHTSISTPYQYFLIFWPSNICLHFPPHQTMIPNALLDRRTPFSHLYVSQLSEHFPILLYLPGKKNSQLVNTLWKGPQRILDYDSSSHVETVVDRSWGLLIFVNVISNRLIVLILPLR